MRTDWNLAMRQTSMAGLICLFAAGCTLSVDLDTGPLPGTCSKDADCDDKLPCTTDSCSSGKCSTSPMKGYCLISKICITEGTPNPLNACQKCDTTKTSAAWSDLANSAKCDDKKSCTFSDTCTAGKCAGTDYNCGFALSCATKTCNGKGPPIAVGCDTTISSGWCLIEGKCYAKDATYAPDTNLCTICDPTKNQTAWSVKAGCTPTTVCGNGKKEAGEECDGSVPAGTTCSSLGFASGGTVTCGTFSCKLDTTACTAKWAWAVGAGGPEYDRGNSLASDGAGGVIFTGDHTAAIGKPSKFGSIELSSDGSPNAVVAKLSSSGTWLWAKDFSSTKDGGSGRVVLSDGKGGVTAIGNFSTSIYLGSKKLTSAGGSDIYITQVDQFGAASSAINMGGSGSQYPLVAVKDSAGNTYMAGYYYYSATFGKYTFNANAVGFKQRLWVAKVDPAGKTVWAADASTYYYDVVNGIGIDSSGNTYISGWFMYSAKFGNTTLTSKGGKDIFVAKLNSAGTYVKVVQAGANYEDIASDMHVDSKGNIFITGHFNTYGVFGSQTLTGKGGDDIYVALLDSNLNFKWAESYGSTGADRGTALAVPAVGEVYLAATFGGSMKMGKATYTSAGKEDILVARLNAAGSVQRAMVAGGTGSDTPMSIAVDKNGSLLMTGTFEGKASFGSKSITSQGKLDIFVAKIPRM